MAASKENPWRNLKIPPEVFAKPENRRRLARTLMKEQVFSRYPRFWEALEADTKAFLRGRLQPEPLERRRDVIRAALRLAWESDAFIGLVLYRARGRLLARDIPVLPGILHRVCMALCQMSIGEPVVIEPGVYIPHGQIVVDGKTLIEKGVVLTPWISIGLRRKGFDGPTLREGTFIGTGAKVLGNITVGPHAQVAANAVVIHDVPAMQTVAGAPARPVVRRAPGQAPAPLKERQDPKD